MWECISTWCSTSPGWFSWWHIARCAGCTALLEPLPLPPHQSPPSTRSLSTEKQNGLRYMMVSGVRCKLKKSGEPKSFLVNQRWPTKMRPTKKGPGLANLRWAGQGPPPPSQPQPLPWLSLAPLLWNQQLFKSSSNNSQLLVTSTPPIEVDFRYLCLWKSKVARRDLPSPPSHSEIVSSWWSF